MNVNNVLMMRFRLRCKDCANSLVDKKFVMAHIDSVHIEEKIECFPKFKCLEIHKVFPGKF